MPAHGMVMREMITVSPANRISTIPRERTTDALTPDQDAAVLRLARLTRHLTPGILAPDAAQSS